MKAQLWFYVENWNKLLINKFSSESLSDQVAWKVNHRKTGDFKSFFLQQSQLLATLSIFSKEKGEI